MPNTFLNTARTIAATSNPQANVQQVTPNNIQQPVSSNLNGTNGVQTSQTPQNNGINPITIPIQIQPQVAQTNPTQGIQTISSQQQVQPNQAPVPQQYQGNSQNNNVVDFNQIYDSYQNNFGNNANQQNANVSSSGIKRSSIGTTIVTPTTNDLNSIKGQYQSAYADTINGLLAEMLEQMQNGFQYDPNTDNALKAATEYASNATLQSLAGSGVLNSSATTERVARIVSELIPQYEEKAHGRWIEYLGQLANTAQVVMDYDSQQFQYWKDARDQEFKEKQLEYQKRQDEIENAWKRVDELGYVDNNASTVLGVKVGTVSGAAREAKEQREFELKKMREQLEIQRANDEALARLKAELDLESSKQLAELENNLTLQRNKELSLFENELNKNFAQFESDLNTKRSKELAEFENNLNIQKSKELAEFENNLNIQKSKELAEFESKLNLQNSKDLAAFESQLNREETENNYKLAQTYGSSKSSSSSSGSNSSTTSLNTYRDIINNRYANYDEITKRYTTSNNVDLYNYLISEYTSGRLSASDLATLTAMYGVTQPTDSEIAQAERRKYLESLSK